MESHCQPETVSGCSSLIKNEKGRKISEPLNLESGAEASVGLRVCTDAVAQRVLRLAATRSLAKACVCRAGWQLHRASWSKHRCIMLLRHLSVSDVYRRGNKTINRLEARWIASHRNQLWWQVRRLPPQGLSWLQWCSVKMWRLVFVFQSWGL